jgi:hypothetical protein
MKNVVNRKSLSQCPAFGNECDCEQRFSIVGAANYFNSSHSSPLLESIRRISDS